MYLGVVCQTSPKDISTVQYICCHSPILLRVFVEKEPLALARFAGVRRVGRDASRYRLRTCTNAVPSFSVSPANLLVDNHLAPSSISCSVWDTAARNSPIDRPPPNNRASRTRATRDTAMIVLAARPTCTFVSWEAEEKHLARAWVRAANKRHAGVLAVQFCAADGQRPQKSTPWRIGSHTSRFERRLRERAEAFVDCVSRDLQTWP